MSAGTTTTTTTLPPVNFTVSNLDAILPLYSNRLYLSAFISNANSGTTYNFNIYVNNQLISIISQTGDLNNQATLNLSPILSDYMLSNIYGNSNSMFEIKNSGLLQYNVIISTNTTALSYNTGNKYVINSVLQDFENLTWNFRNVGNSNIMNSPYYLSNLNNRIIDLNSKSYINAFCGNVTGNTGQNLFQGWNYQNQFDFNYQGLNLFIRYIDGSYINAYYANTITGNTLNSLNLLSIDVSPQTINNTIPTNLFRYGNSGSTSGMTASGANAVYIKDFKLTGYTGSVYIKFGISDYTPQPQFPDNVGKDGDIEFFSNPQCTLPIPNTFTSFAQISFASATGNDVNTARIISYNSTGGTGVFGGWLKISNDIPVQTMGSNGVSSISYSSGSPADNFMSLTQSVNKLIDSNTDYYAVIASSGFTNTNYNNICIGSYDYVNYDFYKFRINNNLQNPNKVTKPYNIHWINKLGGQDSFDFTKPDNLDLSIKKSVFENNYLNKVYYQQLNNKFSIISDWMSEQTSFQLSDLLGFSNG